MWHFLALNPSLQKFVINIANAADLTLNLQLWADDLTKLQLSVCLTTEACIIEFDRNKQTCVVNGEMAKLACIQASHKAQIGELQFAKPELDKSFAMLQGKDVLAKQVMRTAEQACSD